ncbi:hypothetical protein NUW54_g14713 [Trametes sanguinea]|uniref:Uncharacterized protein n=1 Tax=Trametes sanguinea TaxID=158606 RepID=A0ACC1MB90_9APHY|nr:hypothetical protein NUW54_g14713 [Trametes sanguinea]
MSAHSHIEKIDKEPELVNANPPPVVYPFGQSPYYRKLGDPGPLGLYGFASTTFILSMYNVQARGVITPNVVVGMALFVGGLAQFVAGMWEFATSNTFGATGECALFLPERSPQRVTDANAIDAHAALLLAAFTMYGGFWMSFATIFIPGSGVTAAYTSESELNSALGIYLFTWMIVTFLLFVATLRRNMGLVVLFFFLTITFALLGSGTSSFSSQLHVPRASR